jgi:Papain-like cysteine protease AvrRpt2
VSGESFDVNFPDVELINQPTGMSCWAASAAMVVGWRDQVSIDPTAIVAGTGIWSAYTNGLQPTDFQTLANAWGLTAEPPQCYSVDGLRTLLTNKGPFWSPPRCPGSTPSSSPASIATGPTTTPSCGSTIRGTAIPERRARPEAI